MKFKIYFYRYMKIDNSIVSYFCLFLYNKLEEICGYVAWWLEEFWKKASNKAVFFHPTYFCPFPDIEHVNKQETA